jgi:hypothetical protein
VKPFVHLRRPPEIEVLLAALERHGVQYVLVGSAAAWMYGAEIDPRDLDVVPALDQGRRPQSGGTVRRSSLPRPSDGDRGNRRAMAHVNDVLGNPTVIAGVGVAHLRYPVRKV